MLSRAISAPLPLSETVLALAKSLSLCLLCSYIFDICNQTTSPEEDYVNKPDRPIPSGLITVEQGKTRWLMAWTIGPIAMYVLFGPWAMLHLLHWEVLITVCYVWPRWFSWFMRNYFVSFSYCILGRLLNQVLAQGIPAWNISFLIDVSIFVWFMGTIHIQEFHDLEGDRKSDRTTLPMLLSPRGLVLLRFGTSLFTLLFGLGLAFTGYKKIGQDMITPMMSGLQLFASGILAYRISASTSAQYDRVTFHVYYYIPVLTILLTMVLVIK